MGGRPFTGAWIETSGTSTISQARECRPFTGAWIETNHARNDKLFTICRPFTGAWIETEKQLMTWARRSLSPLHGGVD